MVGSIVWTATKGQKVQRGDELGYFAYGGSTVVVLFPNDLDVKFDEDMANWSTQGFETVLQVGEGVAIAKPS